MGNTRRFSVALLLALVGLLTTHGQLHAAYYNYFGTIYDQGGIPVSGVRVAALCKNSSGQTMSCPVAPGGTVVTGSDGVFNITVDTSGCASNFHLHFTISTTAWDDRTVTSTANASNLVETEPAFAGPPAVGASPLTACSSSVVYYYPASACCYPQYCYSPCRVGWCGRRCR